MKRVALLDIHYTTITVNTMIVVRLQFLQPILWLIAGTLVSARDTEAQTLAGDTGHTAVEELLRRHHEQRVAHLLGDARMLTTPFAADFIEISRGRVTLPAPETARARFASYFSAVRFLEWENVRPPRIRISPDESWAEVLVEKRVRTIPADTTRSKQQASVRYAWAERWVRADGGWRMATIASTDRAAEETRPASLPERVRAYEILRRARQALGGDSAVARIATMRFSAECEGPRGAFTTTVASARDGRVSFVQRFPTRPMFAAGISLDGPWQRSGGGATVDTVGLVLGAVVAAHEMHLLAIAPEARYSAPAARPSQTLDGREVHVVELTDPLGGPALFFYDAATGLPAGFQPANHTGRGAGGIMTRFGDWRQVGGVRLPFHITITQGPDVYRYRITNASVDWLPDTAFQPTAADG